MTDHIRYDSALDELAQLLEIWGGDAGRWPAHVSSRIVAMLALPGAQTLLDEARALDRLIDAARDARPRLEPTHARALTDRIMAAAMADMRDTEAPQRVVPFPARAPAMLSAKTKSFERQWQAVGLMAASLLAGVYIGGNINVGPVMQELADAAGISSVVYPALAEDLGEDETL